MIRITIPFKRCLGCKQRKQATEHNFHRKARDPSHRNFKYLDPYCKTCKRIMAAPEAHLANTIVLRGDLEIATRVWLTPRGCQPHPLIRMPAT